MFIPYCKPSHFQDTKYNLEQNTIELHFIVFDIETICEQYAMKSEWEKHYININVKEPKTINNTPQSIQTTSNTTFLCNIAFMVITTFVRVSTLRI